MSTHRMVLRVLGLVVVLSLVIVPTALAAPCPPPGPAPNVCIELRLKTWTGLPYFTDGVTTQNWPNPPGLGCLADATPNWAGPMVLVDATAPTTGPIQSCWGDLPGPPSVNFMWVKSGRDVGPMAPPLKWINDLENVSFTVNHVTPPNPLPPGWVPGIIPDNVDFDWVSIQLECKGTIPLHSVQVYFYDEPLTLVEQQLIEPPQYPAVPVIPGTTSAPPHGAPGINRYVLDTSPGNPTWFHRIEIEPQIGSACEVVNVNGFKLIAH